MVRRWCDDGATMVRRWCDVGATMVRRWWPRTPPICRRLCQSGFCHHSAPGNAGHAGSGSSASLNRPVSALRKIRCWLVERLLLRLVRWLRLRARLCAADGEAPGPLPGQLGPTEPRVRAGSAAARPGAEAGTMVPALCVAAWGASCLPRLESALLSLSQASQ